MRGKETKFRGKDLATGHETENLGKHSLGYKYWALYNFPFLTFICTLDKVAQFTLKKKCLCWLDFKRGKNQTNQTKKLEGKIVSLGKCLKDDLKSVTCKKFLGTHQSMDAGNSHGSPRRLRSCRYFSHMSSFSPSFYRFSYKHEKTVLVGQKENFMY